MVGLATVTLILGLFAFANGEFDPNEVKEEEMYNCFFAILCGEWDAYPFKRIVDRAGPQMKTEGFRWLKEISDIDAEDTKYFWDHYPEFKCHFSDELKRQYFFEWLKRLGEYWATACAEQDSEECIKMGEAAEEYEKVNTEYTLNGVCQSEGVETMEGMG
ncbi:hypothetical protein X975_03402, partial [Stegodyphus mimosarum]